MLTLGSFSNDDGDGDGKKNGQKVIVLLRKKKTKITTFHVHHTFLYISFPSLHDYHVKMPNITLVSDNDFSLSF